MDLSCNENAPGINNGSHDGIASSNTAQNNTKKRAEDGSKFYNLPSRNKEYFDPVIGVPISEENKDEAQYVLDPNDVRETKEKNINSLVDVCESDKRFFCLWNEFIKDKCVYNYKAEQFLMSFIKQRGEEVIKGNLGQNFMFHLVVMFEDNIIDKGTYESVMRKFYEMNEKLEEN